MQEIRFVPATSFNQKPDESKMGFGKLFTDYMFMMEYDPEKVRDYLRLLEGLDFTHCISGHSEVKTRTHQLASLKEVL